MGIYTSLRIRDAFYGKIFKDHTALWDVIQRWSSNSLRRFQMEKRIRSNEFGFLGCYFIRKLANNFGEPQRSYALNAIDRDITFWKGKRVPRPMPLRAPWLLSPSWTRDLCKLMTSHTALMKLHISPLQPPSIAVVFTKNPSVIDSLCNHKEFATPWADGEESVYLRSVATICSVPYFFLIPPIRGRRHFNLFIRPAYIYCKWISTKQDLPTYEGALQVLPEGLRHLASKKLSSFDPTSSYCRSLARSVASPPSTRQPTHHPQIHHTLQTTLSGIRVPQ